MIYEGSLLSNFNIIEDEAEEYSCKDKFYDYCIEGYSFARSFDSANDRFDKLIRPYFQNFSFQQLKNLARACPHLKNWF